ncbi:hypothetical protein KDE12_07950 [Campylobacter sp. faydin G-105]|uniref:hypothetical protein n=1 Tax=Campylobacter anatolicus TaxID=2829105 RepID=UPI001B9FEF38|nr:hypothetical protein [Campylobacter anatolicus]MBR8462771.1 hypothetical protein [Campylobacter anatolicus]
MYRRKIFIKFYIIFAFFIKVVFANEDEDLKIMQALMFQDSGDTRSAIVVYEGLYNETKHNTYLKEALKLAFVSQDKDFDRLLKISSKVLKDDSDFIRIKVADFVNHKRFSIARQIIKDLVTREPSVQNIIILGTICMLENDSIMALKYFEEAYSLSKSEDSVLRIADVLLNRLDNQNEALKYLEDFRQENGCTIAVCGILLDQYLSRGELDNMIQIYEKLYEISLDSSYLDKAVEIFVYKKDIKGAIEFLKKHNYNEKMLMQLYVAMSNYGDAYVLAAKLYNQTRDVELLALMAIYEYEMHRENINEKQLQNVIANFESSVVKLDNAIYLNYYGYLLIDRGIDVRKGIGLVEKALEIEPNSPYYQDSLAWGYFKLGECKKAKSIMLKAMEDSEFSGSQEAQKHLHDIQNCIINLDKRLAK